MMHCNDTRALIGVLLRGQDVVAALDSIKSGLPITIGTYDTYLGLAQQILESSWNPNNYKPPAGSIDQQRVDEAIATLILKGYTIVYPDVAKELNLNEGQITSLVDAWKLQPPATGASPQP